MRKFTIVAILAAFALVACGGGQKALKTKSGGPVVLKLLVDPGIKATTDEEKAGQLRQVSEYMKTDLLKRLQKAKYQVTLVDSKEGFAPADDTYLLAVTISAYNPGDKAARILVGGGAGAASLAVHYDLFEAQGEPFAANDFVSAGGQAAGAFGGGWAGGGYGDWDTVTQDVDAGIVKLIRRDFEKKLGTL